MLEALEWVGAALMGYLIGAAPTAYLVTRLALGRDIRSLGDRNSGAANVFRNVGARAGIAVGIIDIVKGAAAALLLRLATGDPGLAMAAGIAAVVGHNWPVFLRFRGGRGAATAVGALLALLPMIALPTGALALALFYFKRRAIYPLAFFLVAVPLLAWPADYPLSLTLFALAVPLFVGLSHYYTTRILRPPEPPPAAMEN